MLNHSTSYWKRMTKPQIKAILKLVFLEMKMVIIMMDAPEYKTVSTYYSCGEGLEK